MRRRIAARAGPLATSCFVAHRYCSTQNGSPEPPAAELLQKHESLKLQLAECQKQIEKLRTESLYSAATCENIRKEAREEAKRAQATACERFAADMLEVCDALDVVGGKVRRYRQTNTAISAGEASVLAGIELTESVALKVLRRFGVSRLATEVGTPFDKDKQEKLFTVPSAPNLPAGCVAKIVKHGYEMNGSVLRRAEVGVSEDP